MSAQLIKALIPLLPCFAEEEGDFYKVKRVDLINYLCQQVGIETAIAENTVNLCEILLDSLATLNRGLLKKGVWCFVSFPAQLMALSVLTAMGDSDSSFFENDFWNTHTVDNAKKEQQRAVLNLIENKRLAVHSNQSATPIRYIYVAWSIINPSSPLIQSLPHYFNELNFSIGLSWHYRFHINGCFIFSYRVGVNVQSSVYLFLSGLCFTCGSQMNDSVAISRQSNGQALLGRHNVANAVPA